MKVEEIELKKEQVFSRGDSISLGYGNNSMEFHSYMCEEYLKFFEIRNSLKETMSNLETDRIVSRTISQYESEKRNLENSIDSIYCTSSN